MTTASASLLIDLAPRHLAELTEEAADLGTWAVLADQPLDSEHGLSADQREQVRQALRRAAAGSRAPVRAATGPRGSRIGDVILAEGSRWRVVALDPSRREAICSLMAGAHVLHRFRTRQIIAVERAARTRSRGDALTIAADQPQEQV